MKFEINADAQPHDKIRPPLLRRRLEKCMLRMLHAVDMMLSSRHAVAQTRCRSDDAALLYQHVVGAKAAERSN